MTEGARAVTAYVGVGSNLGSRKLLIEQAVEALEDSFQDVEMSPLYESEPLLAHGGRFLNAVVSLSTTESARNLLDRLLEIEVALGRVRTLGERRTSGRHAAQATASTDSAAPGEEANLSEARVIDLDLLLFGDDVITEEGLIVPHPRMTERLFVLQPLVDLCPEVVVPGGVTRQRSSALELLAALQDSEPSNA